jgi:uncharacterized protein
MSIVVFWRSLITRTVYREFACGWAAATGWGNLLRSVARSACMWRNTLRFCTVFVLCFTLLSLLGGCAWLNVKQRQLVYRPTPVVGNALPAAFKGLRTGDETFFIDVPPQQHALTYIPEGRQTTALDMQAKATPQRIELWWLPHPDPQAPTLLYLHGTFRNLFQNSRKIEALRDAGFAVLAVDYRGWGRSTPLIPSQKTILQDAELAWAELVRREPRAAQRVIFGHSLGSAVAVELASHRKAGQDYGALILESAFTNFSETANEFGALAGLVAKIALAFSDERFDSREKISRVDAPLLMLHGSADKTIPFVLGERLFATANTPKQWALFEGGTHSGLDIEQPEKYRQTVQRFAEQFILSK